LGKDEGGSTDSNKRDRQFRFNIQRKKSVREEGKKEVLSGSRNRHKEKQSENPKGEGKESALIQSHG
jgi:hypothetical protein